jgi:uncharacterized protein YeaO (DUF488 family)
MTASPSKVRLQRAYDDPTPDDGHRVLVDRLWPRGRTKEQLRLDAWARELGPSTQLRKWFGHDPARWPEFQARYQAELAEPARAQALAALAERARRGPVTLVFGARDREYNQAVVIADEIERRLGIVGGSPTPVGIDADGDHLVPPRTARTMEHRGGQPEFKGSVSRLY